MKEPRVSGTSTRVLRRAALACEAALAAAGVRARIVGSLAYGAARPDSDLDLLVLAHRGRSWAEVQSIAAAAARPFGIPVELIFAETLSTAVRRDAERRGWCRRSVGIWPATIESREAA